MVQAPVLGIVAIVGHALPRAALVGALVRLDPTVAPGVVFGHAESQSLLERRLGDRPTMSFFGP